jgi:hypothetical protein
MSFASSTSSDSIMGNRMPLSCNDALRTLVGGWVCDSHTRTNCTNMNEPGIKGLLAPKPTTRVAAEQ